MTGDRQVMRRGWRPLVALAASYLLVLQVLLTGLTMIGHPASAAADGLAAVICTPDGIQTAPGHPDAPVDPHGLTCCLIGCSGAGPAVAPPAAAVAAGFVKPAPAPIPPGATDRPADGHRHSPGRARAPPPTA